MNWTPEIFSLLLISSLILTSVLRVRQAVAHVTPRCLASPHHALTHPYPLFTHSLRHLTLTHPGPNNSKYLVILYILLR
jgi:hypothetical protein